MSDSDTDTDRTTIKTYVPGYQKAEWAAHAEELEMSQSEFVRAMVQAGRKGFEPSPEEPTSPDPDPGGKGLETRVRSLLNEETYSWDELLELVSEDIETRLEDALETLQAQNEIKYSGRHGGYTTIGGADGD